MKRVYSGATGTNTLHSTALTADGSDTYAITKSGSVVAMTAYVNNTGSNLRRIFWPTGQVNRGDTLVNATWAARSVPSLQEGTAHRIVVLPDRVRAVTVTKNVWAEVYWGFNVHVWDSSQSPAFTQVAQFDMANAVFDAAGSYKPLPWRVSTFLQANTMRFKIWFPPMMSEPGWMDPIYARSGSSPADWGAPGQSGWYIGHIPPSGSAQYTSLEIWTP